MQQLLELTLILSQTALCLHHRIFVLCTLGGELSQIGFAHAAYSDKFFAARLVGLGSLKRGLVDIDGILGIEDLHKELCDLFLDAVGCRSGIEAGLIDGELVELHLVVILIAVPHRPGSVDTVGTVVVSLVDIGLHLVTGKHVTTTLGPRVVGDIVRCRRRQRRQQGCLALQQGLLCTLIVHHRFAQRDVVGQRIADTLTQSPLLGQNGHVATAEQQ